MFSDEEGYGLSASVPDDLSPIKAALRPSFTRQRSSSTQYSRPKLPAWRHDLPKLEIAALDRSDSNSPPSLASSSSFNAPTSVATSPELADVGSRIDSGTASKRSFKRAVTVPTRPRIPGTWEHDIEAPTSAQQPSAQRFASSTTVRRVYNTPGGVRPALRPSTAPRALPPASSTSSPHEEYEYNDDEDGYSPNVPPVPQLLRTDSSPLTGSSSNDSIGGGGSLARRPALANMHAMSHDARLQTPPTASRSHHLQRSAYALEATPLTQLRAALADDSDTDEDEHLRSPLPQSQQQDNQNPKDLATDDDLQSPLPRNTSQTPLPPPSHSNPSSAGPSPVLMSISPIPPYRGRDQQYVRPDVPHQRMASNTVRGPLPTSTSEIAETRSKLLPGVTRSAAPLAVSPVEVSARHRRSPTAPSNSTGAASGSEGKENRARAVYQQQSYHHSGAGSMSVAAQQAQQRFNAHADLMRQRELEEQDRERDQREQDRRDDAAAAEWERENRERVRDREREKEKEKEREREREREQARTARVSAERPPPHPPSGNTAGAGTSAGASTSADPRNGNSSARDKRYIPVRKRNFLRLECIGRGGSSRVFRALDESTHKIYAIKKVTLERADAETVRSYQNEIQLLLRLKNKPGIIDLVEYETRKSYITMVLELGDVDFNTLISQRVARKFNLHKIGDAWQQMLEAVHVIHEDKIVHSDLKPANFVLVRGELKLIDFGIAKAIANDTTNIQREQQIGTVNYMSPEAIEETKRNDGRKIMKLGRASDVWSLGCILYQMVYGRPPFHAMGMLQKIQAIPDATHGIHYPEISYPIILGNADTPDIRKPDEEGTRVPIDVINSMRMCLVRDPKKRATIPELQAQAWVTGNQNFPEAVPLPHSPPAPKPILKEDESVISQKNMLQLLNYVAQLTGGQVDNAEAMSKLLMENLKSVQRPL